jgi:hypothetical protein
LIVDECLPLQIEKHLTEKTRDSWRKTFLFAVHNIFSASSATSMIVIFYVGLQRVLLVNTGYMPQEASFLVG